ncbi:ATG1 Serine/threonine-protein kinase ATG1 [Candida maltosa Xu316]|uniref:Serine/threonine-protein kinase ATG1 n=1 Tax=Candida maltosa (strain Xu316) TaxID=1245528 RepID=M3HLA9_CANMX|nr:hypothetical protein G210_1299 [Candida maltosa Xu316]
MSKVPSHQRTLKDKLQRGDETEVSTNASSVATSTLSVKSHSNSKSEYIGIYKIGPEIGKGSFATVYKCINTTNNKAVAIKSVYRSKLKSKKLIENLEIEISILKTMKHPHIVGLLDYKQTTNYFHLVMDYCSMGDLSYFIRRRNQLVKTHPVISSLLQRYPSPEGSHGLNEVLVLHFLKQLSSALSFLRDKSLVHRDIKPQNLLLCPPVHSKQDFIDGQFVGLWELPILKIADFGFARFLPSTSMAETLCGSPLYMAPEILRYEKYNAKADLWSVGAVLYEMTVGRPPFKAGNHIELLKNIEKANDNIKFPSAAKAPVELKRLIKSLLKYNPTERISFNEFFSDALIVNDLEETNQPLETSQMDENLFISEYISPIKPSERSQFISPIVMTAATPEKNHTQQPPQEEQKGLEVATKQPASSPSPNTSIKHDNETDLDLKLLNDLKVGDDLMLEKDYVVVERREFPNEESYNMLAQQKRRSSSGGSNRRPSFTDRRISISPTNALSKALFLASHKLFGGTTSNNQNTFTPVSAIAEDDDLVYGAGTGSGQRSGNNEMVALVSATTTGGENDEMVLSRLETLANMAHSVKTLADVKYKQVIPSPPSSDNIEEVGLPDEIVSKISEDGMKLYNKTLSLLAKGMQLGGQWDSETYDVCLQRFEILSAKALAASPVSNHTNAVTTTAVIDDDDDEIDDDANDGQEQGESADTILYKRALEIAREAAVNEISRKDINNCLISYTTAYYMLLAVLESENLTETEQSEIKKIVEKILNRINMLNK